MNVLEAIAIIVGVISGMTGLVLGILNYKHQRDTTRPRILVRPRVWNLIDRSIKKSEENVRVMEICNVGQVSVIGSTIGILRGPGQDKDHLFVNPESINGVKWAGQLLKPQHVALLRFKLDDLPEGDKLGSAFARTIVDDSFKASRSDMHKFAKARKNCV